MKSAVITAGRGEEEIDLERIDAFIFDLDGVVTDTARVHAAAWKEAFDEFLRDRAAGHDERFRPFDAEDDYLRYVDGKPRYDGAWSFLSSRGISLPYGDSRDPPGTPSVCGLGNRKDELFLRALEREGVRPYPSTEGLLRRLRAGGKRLALISSSRHAKEVLRAARLSDVFDAVVDGVDSVGLGLRGKPAPDIFLEAARRLNVGPDQAAVVEDALAGVEAGRAGGFAAVIGVDRAGRGTSLLEHGADIVVADLSELEVGEAPVRPAPALDHVDSIFRRLREGVPAVFLDYDGTLTPIVREPSLALLSEDVRATLAALAKHCLVAIVSGRDLADVQSKVGLDELTYVGSHGFEVRGPGEAFRDLERGEDLLPALDAAEGDLRDAVAGVEGARVERKRFAIALHYREVGEGDLAGLEQRFDGVARRHPDLRRTRGKKVLELRPNIDWDKGRMVLSLLGRSHVNGSRAVPLYIGDDVTDEDAFRAIDGRGVSVLVSDHDQATAAGYVLHDPSEVHAFLRTLVGLFEREVSAGVWSLVYEGFDAENERLRESLCALGNGYMASRGAAPESSAGPVHYPGTYLGGVYNRLRSEVQGVVLENESIVNVPNWLCLSLRIDDGPELDLGALRLDNYRQELDMRNGFLTRTVRFTDGQGRQTLLRQRRLVSMACPRLAALETTITPENWSGRLRVTSSLDGRVDNTQVERYRQLNGHHLGTVGTGARGDDTIWLQAETNQSHIRVAEAARTRVDGGAVLERRVVQGEGRIGQELELLAREGRPVRVEKVVAICSSRDRAISESLIEALDELDRAGGADELSEKHARRWEALWERCRIDVDAGHDWVAQTLNLHIFHLLQTASAHSTDLDVGIPPRGLTGEAYRGLIMWDELFIFPFLNLHMPDVTRALLLYRYRRLPRARWDARREGLRGAMFPWMSGSDGREEAQTLHLNPISGQWIPDHSRLERHIGLAVAYNVWQYYQVTGDTDFMSSYGAEMLVEVARFWASKARFDESRGRYVILGVMGPDEFHEKYPAAAEPGIDNNAYTNVLAAWALGRALDAVRALPLEHHRDLLHDLSIEEGELERWDDISRRMFVPFLEEGVIAQFDGYGDLEELDMEAYRKRYCNIHRLDRILKAEGSSPDEYKISKQADALMLFYLFSPQELGELFERLGYDLDADATGRTIDYYMARTCHGSTLSRLVHAWVLSRRDRELSWNLFLEALRSDVSDIQGGTTREGIHLGAMAGTVDLVQRCYAGLETRRGALWFDPCLPPGLRRLRFEVEYRHHRVEVDVDQERLRLTSWTRDAPPISIGFRGTVRPLAPGGAMELPLRSGEGPLTGG